MYDAMYASQKNVKMYIKKRNHNTRISYNSTYTYNKLTKMILERYHIYDECPLNNIIGFVYGIRQYV